jgi:hypothetical protein
MCTVPRTVCTNCRADELNDKRERTKNARITMNSSSGEARFRLLVVVFAGGGVCLSPVYNAAISCIVL